MRQILKKYPSSAWTCSSTKFSSSYSDPLDYHGLPFPALLAMPLQMLLQQCCELSWLGAFPGLKLVFSSLISVELYIQVCKKCDWADCYGWKEWEMLVKLWVKPLWKWLYCTFVMEKETLHCWKANWKNEINLEIGKAGRNGKGVWGCRVLKLNSVDGVAG